VDGRANDPDLYLAEHVREALAGDPRVSELGVDVAISGQSVVLRGTLPSRQRQEAAVALVRQLLPRHHVRDETVIADFPEPTEVEHLP
jgi:osmotically-inducible protein OsmY